MTWRPAPDGVLAFDRGDGLCCVTNLSAAPVRLPGHDSVLLASGPLTNACCPPTPQYGCAVGPYIPNGPWLWREHDLGAAVSRGRGRGHPDDRVAGLLNPRIGYLG